MATLRHVPDDGRFVRPDLCLWFDGVRALGERVVPPDVPDTVMADLLDQVIAPIDGTRARPPTELVVPDEDLALSLRARYGDRFVVNVRVRESAERFVARMVHARGSDDEDPPRTILDRAMVTAEAVSAVHADFASLVESPRWKSLSPWALRFALRAADLGWPEGTVTLHGASRRAFLSKTESDRRGRTLWRRGARPRETRTMEIGFVDAERQSNALAEDADAYGWRATHDPSAALMIRAWDVGGLPRPLAGDDLVILGTAVAALRAWLAEHDPHAPAGASVTVPHAELVGEGRHIDPLAEVDAARVAWRDEALPLTRPLDVRPEERESVLERLRRAVPGQREQVARALAAEGDATTLALLASLDDDALWDPPKDAPWLVPWVLAALAWSRDGRVPVHMLRALALWADTLEDFLTECLPAVLTTLGPDAVEALGAVLHAAPVDEYLRIAAGTALYLIAVDHPQARDRVRALFAELYEELADTYEDGALATCLAREATLIHSPRVDAAMRSAHDAGIWEPSFSGKHAPLREDHGEPWRREGKLHAQSLDDVMSRPWWDGA